MLLKEIAERQLGGEAQEEACRASEVITSCVGSSSCKREAQAVRRCSPLLDGAPCLFAHVCLVC